MVRRHVSFNYTGTDHMFIISNNSSNKLISNNNNNSNNRLLVSEIEAKHYRRFFRLSFILNVKEIYKYIVCVTFLHPPTKYTIFL